MRDDQKPDLQTLLRLNLDDRGVALKVSVGSESIENQLLSPCFCWPIIKPRYRLNRSVLTLDLPKELARPPQRGPRSPNRDSSVRQKI